RRAFERKLAQCGPLSTSSRITSTSPARCASTCPTSARTSSTRASSRGRWAMYARSPRTSSTTASTFSTMMTFASGAAASSTPRNGAPNPTAPATVELGREGRARDQDQVAGDELDETAGLAKKQLGRPADGPCANGLTAHGSALPEDGERGYASSSRTVVRRLRRPGAEREASSCACAPGR